MAQPEIAPNDPDRLCKGLAHREWHARISYRTTPSLLSSLALCATDMPQKMVTTGDLPSGFHPKESAEPLPTPPRPNAFQPPPAYQYNNHGGNKRFRPEQRGRFHQQQPTRRTPPPSSRHHHRQQQAATALPTVGVPETAELSKAQTPVDEDTNNPNSNHRSGFQTVAITMPGSRKIQHFTICVGNRPEDIQAWIAARKRNFPRQKKSLDTLLDGYGSSSSSSSSSDSDDNEEKETTSAPAPKRHKTIKASEPTASAAAREQQATPPKQRPVSKHDHRNTVVCHFFQRTGTCRRGSACAYAHTAAAPAPTLLQRLLENDQRRERILTLQLLQYMLYESPTLSRIGTTSPTAVAREDHGDDRDGA